MQVFQESFADAFAALLDLPSGKFYPMVYLYCLEEALHADGQLTHVLVPAYQVNMDSSVNCNILSVDVFKVAAGNTSIVKSSMKGDHEQKLHGCSGLDTGLRCNETYVPEITFSMAGQQCLSELELFLKDDLMPSPAKSPTFGLFSLFDDDEE
jgi:hypothetical protein